MEGQGTDMDKWLGLEKQINSLAAETAAEIGKANLRLDGVETSVHKMDREIRADLKNIATLLDEQRTRRPDLVALGGLFLALTTVGFTALAGMWILFQAQVNPIREDLQMMRADIATRTGERWTKIDHLRYKDTVSEAMRREADERRLENREIREDIRRLEERLWEEGQ